MNGFIQHKFFHIFFTRGRDSVKISSGKRHTRVNPITFLSLIICFFVINPVFAQWHKIANYDNGVTGKLATYNNILFAYGYQGGVKMQSTADNGKNWADLSSGIPDNFSDIYSFQDSLYAVWLSSCYI